MRSTFSRFTLAAMLALAAPFTVAQADEPAIQAADQAMSNGTIIVTGVTALSDGYIAVHRVDKLGNMNPTANGAVAVKKGASQNLAVPLKFKVPPKPGAVFMVVLHEDTGKIGKFQFNKKHQDVDKPVMAGDRMVGVKIKLL